MGAFGLLLAFAGIVMSRMWSVIKSKDAEIKAEIQKRETLLREVLENHAKIMVAIQDRFGSSNAVLERIEDQLYRIENSKD